MPGRDLSLTSGDVLQMDEKRSHARMEDSHFLQSDR